MNEQHRNNTEENPSPFPLLPEELIVLILLRLPVRSLLRFKCVSKWWLSLISDPEFAKSHFDLAASPTHRLFLNYNDEFQIQALDTESSLNDESSIVNIPVVDPPLAPPPRSAPFGGLKVIGSCRGFVLLATPQGFVVCNPSTGAQRRIPFPRFIFYSSVSCLIGIGYDEPRDDYLLVSIPLFYPDRTIKLFSLKTNLPVSWSMADEFSWLTLDHGFHLNHGLFLNGSLHWMVKSSVNQHCAVLAFDLTERSLLEIVVSHDLALELDDDNKLYYLRVMGGCLALSCSYFGAGVTEIWMMKEYKVQSSWTKMFLFVDEIPRDSRFFPLCFTKCGDFLGTNDLGALLRLNNKGKLLEHYEVWPGHYKPSILYSHNLLYSHMYTESLLSLPSLFEKASEEGDQQKQTEASMSRRMGGRSDIE